MIKKRIICYGDSNTYGFDPRDFGRYGAEHRWPDVMKKLLSESLSDIDFEVINSGLNGRAINLRGIKDWKPGKGMDDLFAGEIARRAPVDLLIIMMGSNNCAGPQTPEMIARGLEREAETALFSDIWSDEPCEPRIVIAIPPVTGGDPDDSSLPLYLRQEIAKTWELIPLYEEIVKRRGFAVVDVNPACRTCSYDPTHITEESHIAVGKLMADAVTKLLNKENAL